MTAKQMNKPNRANKEKQQKQRPVGPPKEGPLAQLEEQDLQALQRAVANPTLAAPADILALQRRYGNSAVKEVITAKEAGIRCCLRSRRENKTGLPDNLKAGIETLSGLSMDDVRVHYNSAKPAQLQALAHTQGTDIHVGPGHEKHLPHEAWHVVQQKQGRVKPTMQAKRTPINDDQVLEREADVMGTEALQMKRTDEIENLSTLPINPELLGAKGKRTSEFSPIQRNRAVVQRKWTEKEEEQAQKKLVTIDEKVIEVPVAKVFNQQAWMGEAEKGMARRIPREYGGGFLQGILAEKVIKVAAKIAAGQVKVEPPPVAFSTETAPAGDPQAGDLILLDSHHTKNAAIMLSGAEKMEVKHRAKPDCKGAETLAQIADSRRVISANMKKAAAFNANEGNAAYAEALRGIEEMRQKTSTKGEESIKAGEQ